MRKRKSYRTYLDAERAFPIVLLALNFFISWRLFRTEYTTHYDSIEPVFYALAGYLKSNWLYPGWWREWNCGMPFRYTYQPLLHYVVAAISGATNLSVARAFHVTIALFYSAGPVALYFLVRRLSGNFRVALTASLLYSFCSPSAWLVPDIAGDTGGAFHFPLSPGDLGNWMQSLRNAGGLLNPRRLHTAVVYADGPYVSGLTLIPLALLMIDRAAVRRSIAAFFFSALSTAAVALINIPAALTLSMGLLAYFFASEAEQRWSRVIAVGISSVLGYLLVAPLIPPSGLLLTATNTQWMDVEAHLSAGKLSLLAVGLLLLFAIGLLLNKLRCSFFARFSTLFLLITATVVLGKSWGHFTVIAQPTRFHLALEMAAAMALSVLIGRIRLRTFRARWAVAIVGFSLIALQVENYRLYARKILKRDDPLEERGEYKIAKWLDQHAQGSRVWVPGSRSFWLNALTTTPQLIGCCDQNFLILAPRIATYEIGTDDGAGSRAAEISLLWLRALGIKYIAMSGVHSSEPFHVLRHPAKFDRVLPKVWEDGEDRIFEVTSRQGSLAHWIKPGEAVASVPVNGIEVAPLERYVAAVEDGGRPQAVLTWLNSAQAEIKGNATADNLLSVQIPFHVGWRAESASGEKVPITHDALGFLLLSPHCNGECQIKLIFDGGRESRILSVVCSLSWLGIGALLFKTRTKSV